MTREYIGARYVPYYFENPDGSSDWIQGIAYEALTIVKYASNSFISKKPVPATVGNPPANPSYWVQTGTDNAQIEELIRKVNNMETNISSIVEDIAENTTNINKVEQELNQLNQADYSYAVYLGNSYAFGTGGTEGNGLYNKTKMLFTDSKLYNGSGTGFAAYDTVTVTFESLLNQAITDSSLDKSKVTDLVILGAWGDSRYETVLGDQALFISNTTTNARNLITKAHNNFPNLKNIYYANCESRNFYAQILFNITNKFINYWVIHRCMAQVCVNTGMKFLGSPGWNILFNKNYFSSDNYHPNNNGYTALAKELIKAFKGELIYIPLLKTNIMGDASAFIQGAEINYSLFATPEYYRLHLNYMQLTNTTNNYTPPSTRTYIKIPIFTKNFPTVGVYPVSFNDQTTTCITSINTNKQTNRINAKGYYDETNYGIQLLTENAFTGSTDNTPYVIPLNLDIN